ncbi:hypothetical protein [Streptomyces sudanensis]|uniref:hypothetical protein n=1 Tax=Streptomyces sudanensis TaxID=436397 RepID=UPI0020CD7CA6|nr:hypothetical protein [Streptomyces sudanensis]MCQ0003193.1 hypothetical protein [Streptomyces sudanensis]
MLNSAVADVSPPSIDIRVGPGRSNRAWLASGPSSSRSSVHARVASSDALGTTLLGWVASHRTR